jgi:HJR/Mrr/RecB family endonuclease
MQKLAELVIDILGLIGVVLFSLFVFGIFILILFQDKFKRMAYLKSVSMSGIEDIDNMKGYQFEDFLLTLFKKWVMKLSKLKHLVILERI